MTRGRERWWTPFLVAVEATVVPPLAIAYLTVQMLRPAPRRTKKGPNR